jgi:hypothetical protein
MTALSSPADRLLGQTCPCQPTGLMGARSNGATAMGLYPSIFERALPLHEMMLPAQKRMYPR